MAITRYHQVLAFFLCLVPVVGVIAPRSLSFMPAIVGLIAFLMHYPYFKEWPRAPKLVVITVGGVIALMALSLLWAYDFEVALGRTIKISPIFLGTILLGSVVFSQGQALREVLNSTIPYAVILAALFLMADLYGGDLIYNLMHSDFDRPAAGNLSHLNRAVAVFVVFMIFGVGMLWQSRNCQIKMAVIVLLSALILFQTHSQSAQLAVIAGGAVMFMLPYRWPKTWVILSILIAVAMIAAPWGVQWLFSELAEWLKTATWIKNGYAAHRLEIWSFVSERALQSPWLGYGVEATRSITDFQSDMLYHKNDKVLHPHNFVIQLWIEFGLLGVSIAIAVMATILRSIWRVPEGSRRFLMALFVSVLMISVTGHGFWQGWWQGLIGYILALSRVMAVSQKNKV